MPKPSNAYVPRKGAAERTYTNADGKKVKYYSVGGDGTFGAAPKPETAKSTTGKTYQEQQNEKNMHSPGSAVKPGQRNPSFAGSAVSKEETKKPAAEKPEKPRRPAEYKTGTPAFLDHPIPMPPPMNYLTGDMDKQVQQMYRDHQRQDIREMPDQLYDIGKPFPNTVKPGQMNGSYTKISDKEPDNRPYRERINSLQDDLTEEVRQRQWMEQANAEYSQARADALHELNMEDIWAMPIEDREELRKYVDADVERRARMGASGPIEFYARDKAASEAFAPLEEKYGEQRAKELAEAMEWYLSEKETERVREYGEKLGHGNFAQKVGGNVLSIAANTAGSITGPMGYLDEAIHRTGQYPTLNPNNMGMTPGVYAGAVREATAQDIEGENGNWFRKGLSYAYQGTMSAADSLARLAVAGEAGGLALAGLGQFGSAVSEASARGASPGQAVCYGVTTASVEVLTEKIPMDDWLKIAKGGKQPLTVAVKNAFKQAGVEITTEEISFVADLMLDATIMQGKSGYNQQVRELEAQGYSRTDAENMASKALLWEAFDTLMASGFSGGGSSVVGSVIANVTDSGTQQEAKAGAEQAGQNAVRDVQSMTDEALGVQQPQIPPAQQEQQAGPQQGPQADLQSMTDDAMGVQQGQQAAPEITFGQPQTAPAEQAAEAVPPVQQAAANQEMFDQTAEALYQPREEAPAQQTAGDVASAADEILGVEEPTGPVQTAVDTGAAAGYNNLNDNTEGVNGYGEQQAAGSGAELHGDVGEGLREGVPGRDSEPSESGPYGQGDLRGPGGTVLSPKIEESLRSRGTTPVPTPQTSDLAAFSAALDEARNQNTKNGWAVSPKSVEELSAPGTRVYMAENGKAGFVLSADGDIEAVFANKQKGAPGHTSESLMLQAIQQGGNKLDCYGNTLASIYARYGFEPVARVAFNQEYANEGWTPDKGTPYIYMMKHNGDSADTVAGKLGTYQSLTKEQLDDLPTFGKNDYDKAMAYRDSLMVKQSTSQTDTQNVSSEGGQKGQPPKSRPNNGGRATKYNGTAKSQFFENSGVNSTDPNINAATQFVNENDPDATYHDVHSQKHIENLAKRRTATPEGTAKWYESLIRKETFDDQDVATAKRIISEMWKSGDNEAVAAMETKLSKELTRMGQGLRAAQNNTMAAAATPQAAVSSFIDQIDSLKPEQTVYKPGKADTAVTGETVIPGEGAVPGDIVAPGDSTTPGEGKNAGFETWKDHVKSEVTAIAMEIDKVQDGDNAAMLDIIRQIAKKRGTTAWFGMTNRLAADAQAVLNTMKFSDLKTVANAQIASMADDFRARTKTEIAQGIRVNNMLSSVKTILRNLGGNSMGGITGALSDSSVGQFADVLLSKFTGKRTVGNDLTHGATYAKGAWNAAKFASMCVELNIPIETSISGLETAFDGKNGNKFVGKTWRANGNLVQRLLYANQKYMSYALEVSDKIFEGGTNATVTKSLENLKNSGLSREDVQQLTEFEANKRTFKDATWEDENGTHGAVLSRKANQVKKVLGPAGDIAMPFTSVPMNVTQTGIDYTPAGIAKGVGEIVSIMKDAKNGKDINVARQRQAVTDFGKGLTGTGLIALAAAAAASGAIKVSNDKDKDKRALEQAQGLSGAQINWSAIERGLRGESAQWQDGDVISSLDFLEPFNTQLYLGWELAQDDSVVEMLKDLPNATVSSVFSSLMDSPMMQGIQDVTDLGGDILDAETGEEKLDAVAAYGGKVAGSWIPQWMRQAAQYTDGYYRDTRGHSAAETAWNQIKAGIPGASESLPKKYSGLGEVQERPGFVGTFIDPTNTHTYHPNEVTDELARISDRNGGAYSIYPDAQAPMTIKDGEETITLTGEQRETYQQEYGSLVNEYYKGIMDSAEYQNMTDEERIEAFEKAEKKATEEAKATITGNRVEVSEEVAAGLEELRKNNPSDYSYLPDKAVPTSISVDGEDIRLTTEQRKTYQEKYSEKVNDYYGALMENEGFQGLSEDRKKEALQKAKEYAADHAKAAVSDFSDVQKGFGRDVAVRIVNDVALKSITDIFGDIDTNTKKGSSNADNIKALDAAYDQVSELPDMQRDKVLGDAESDAAIYFDARESGVGTWDFIQARDAVNSAPGSGSVDKDTGKPKQTNADKYGAIAGLERMTDETIDSLMKAWMPDYDPDNGKTDRAELKYDYARKELRLSPSQYAEAYRVNSQYSKKADKVAAFEKMGFDKNTALQLYKLYGGSDKKFNQKLVELYGG